MSRQMPEKCGAIKKVIKPFLENKNIVRRRQK